jgi:excisionase family DNA binding protein
MSEIKDINEEVKEEINDEDLLDPELVKYAMEAQKAGGKQSIEAQKEMEEVRKTMREARKKQEKAGVMAFDASVKAMLKTVTNDTSDTVTSVTDTNVTVTNVISETDPWLLPHEAAQMLGVTRKTIREWYNNKIIKGIVTGGGQHLRIRTSEVYRIQGLRYTPPAVNPYKDPKILAEAQSSFDTEDANSIFSETYLQQALQTRRY